MAKKMYFTEEEAAAALPSETSPITETSND